MREIIFRGQTDSGEWIKGSLISLHKDGAEIFYLSGSGKTKCVFVRPETVGQFTGLKDKNGKMIFEGDRVIIPNDLWIGDSRVAKGAFKKDAFIEYYKGSFRVNKVGDESKMYYGVIDFSKNTMGYSMEVIGNIHDDKLIKK